MILRSSLRQWSQALDHCEHIVEHPQFMAGHAVRHTDIHWTRNRPEQVSVSKHTGEREAKSALPCSYMAGKPYALHFVEVHFDRSGLVCSPTLESHAPRTRKEASSRGLVDMPTLHGRKTLCIAFRGNTF